MQLQALQVCATPNAGEEAEAAESGSDTEAMSWARRPVTGSRASMRRRRRVRTSTGDATCSSQFRGVSKHRSAAERKQKEEFTLFSDHNGSLMRRQPGAKVSCC